MTKKDEKECQAILTRKVLDDLMRLGYITQEECYEIKKFTYRIPEGECGWSIRTPVRSFALAIEENPGYCDLTIDLYVDGLRYAGSYISANNGIDFRILDNSKEVGEFFVDFI